MPARRQLAKSYTEVRAGAKLQGVLEASLACIPLEADTGAGPSGVFGSFAAGNQVNELREVVVPSRTVTWRTTV